MMQHPSVEGWNSLAHDIDYPYNQGGKTTFKTGKGNTFMTDLKQFGGSIIQNLEQVIVGKTQSLEMVVIGLLCQGHVLIEDVPGVGKTMLARSLAKSLDCTFNRIQFTPDMLPSDVTGVSIFNQQKRKFEFRAGPIMGQIVLADEVNRATPKTQAALLEAMEERQVTVDGVTHPLPKPFMVLATQNPIEYEGTFPLPEAQLDRFLLRVRMGYPSASEEMKILGGQQLRHPIEALKSVLTSRVRFDPTKPRSSSAIGSSFLSLIARMTSKSTRSPHSGETAVSSCTAMPSVNQRGTRCFVAVSTSAVYWLRAVLSVVSTCPSVGNGRLGEPVPA